MYSPDNRVIAIASENGVIRIIDANNYKEIKVIQAHEGKVNWISFSGDSKRLASVGADKSVKVFDLSTFEETMSLKEEGEVE